ncbi:mechanosensitive ion channel protein 10 [Carica papaya]|uniref:mechanosensitive ion channel protein 10 n=1 Tax=Carica papaya TaxID=3649 RepID=UPI000B8C7C57|nr:mechanosensitive ion channel protein 10 [Carica papaya]XP_021890724.1 mechanosensitive ion channel protein 10 [Carica papaya]XP_021890725.1 mechanosensitive ion channel protein 10 [Carica papaya]
MDAKPSSNAQREKAINVVERKSGNGEVVITVSGEGKAQDPKVSSSECLGPGESREDCLPTAAGESMLISCSSPEIARFSPSSNKPPKIPTRNETLTRRKSLARSLHSKPKSRFVEQSYAVDPNTLDEDDILSLREQIGANSPSRHSFDRGSPNNISGRSIRTNSMTPKTPLVPHPGEDENDDEEIYKKVKRNKEKRGRVSAKLSIELVLFACLVGLLAASLTVNTLEKFVIWGLEIWKWCVLVMVIFSGMLLTNWFMHFVVFLIEKNFLLQKKVLYFVHGLKKSVQVFIWLSLILITWVLLFKHGVKRSDTAMMFLNCVTRTLISLLIGAFLWLVKTLLLKILASSFNVNNFFDRIQESVFHQYVLQILSGPPLMEEAERVHRSESTGQLSIRSTKKGKEEKDKKFIDMATVHKLKQEKVSAWTMRTLVEAVRTSGLSTISNALDESAVGDGGEQTDKEITSEMEAIAAAYYIFKNVSHNGRYIDEDDLLRFMIKEEVDLVFPSFTVSETGQIDRKSLTDWVVKVYKGRKALAHALNDTKTAVKQLNKLVSGILIVVTIIIWLLLMEIATTKVILFLSSQLVVVAFIFGNTCKTIFEAIIFVFVMHPFDVGDRCVVDGIQLLVEEMNILTTVFLKLNNEKVFYPNTVLATKPISNYYRSPEMGDTVDFSIDFATPLKKIGDLKDKIRNYLEKNSQHWQLNHNVVVMEIEDVNKLKMALYCNHTINFQDWGEKNRRRTELVIEMKKMFEELGIKYYLLPQQVHLNRIGPELAAEIARV